MSDAKRPGVATVVGVLAIVFSGLGILGGLLGGLLTIGAFFAIGIVGIILGITVILSLAVSVLGLVGGIGMLQDKLSGKNLVNLWAFSSAGLAVLSFILTIVIGGGLNILGLLLGLVLPVIIIILLNQQAIKDHYKA